MSLEEYAEKLGEDLSRRPMPLTGLEGLPDMGALRTARKGDSISSILGSSDPAAIGAFMDVNGMKDSRLRVGESYLIPRRADLADQSMAGRGQAALNADNARAVERARRTILPGDAVAVRPGVTVFDPRKGILAAHPQHGASGSWAYDRRSPSDGAKIVEYGAEGYKAFIGAVKEIGQATGNVDDATNFDRVIKRTHVAGKVMVPVGEALGTWDDVRNKKLPWQTIVPGAVLHGGQSMAAGAIGGAAGVAAAGLIGQMLVPIPGLGYALGAAAGIGAGYLADRYLPTREQWGRGFYKPRPVRGVRQ